MAAGRKLQAEIEKVLKKVEEGIEEFCDVWDSVHNAVHANQREKFEAELKTQIKKLQRDREQIKIWQSDKAIKDKNALAEARKRIEVEMERFKEFERDSKTKQYSKEGLLKSDKVDPHEEEREKHRAWIQNCMGKLQVQIEEMDADIEMATSSKKSKKQDDAGLAQTRLVQETHRWHQTKLEQLLRKLDNDDVELEELDDLRDTVEYYVDDNSRVAGEFQPFDTIYESFGLEEIEDYLTKDKDRGEGRESDKASECSAGVEKQQEPPKAPTKHTAGAAAAKAAVASAPSPTVRSQGRSQQQQQQQQQQQSAAAAAATSASKDDAGGAEPAPEKEKQQHKPWPPMMSVWQNPLPASSAAEKEKERERERAEKEKPSPAAVPPKPTTPVPRPAPTLPPPVQPAPDRPPPPGQAPVLNAPPNQPPPKPAPNQMPQMQPPTQAPPQPPLPSPPLGSPPRPHSPTAAGSVPGTLAGIVSAVPMPAPPPMPPPSPQDAPVTSSTVPSDCTSNSTVPSAAQGAPQVVSAASQPAISEPPATAPPPPPPPVLPPPPPSPAPAPSGPPATTPVLPPGHGKAQPVHGQQEPPQWPPPVTCLSEDMQQAPKVPPPSQAPPPPTESPPGPPAEVPPPNTSGSGIAEAAVLGSSPSANNSVAGSFEPSGALAQSPQIVAAVQRQAETTSQSAAPETGSVDALELLAASHRNLPAPSDGRWNRKYAPRNPYVHVDTAGNAAYPMQPTQDYEDPAMFKKYDLDALFFIFYYQQGSYQQHLAAKELKKLSWRYHTKYLTWFQRHEEPRMTASDFERGAYLYFDHDSGWCQRIKADFTFEYQFLEDEPM